MKKKRAESKALVKKGDGKKGGDGEKGEGHGDGHHHKHEHKSPFSQEENEEFEAADHEGKCKMAGEMTAGLAKEEKSGADMDKTSMAKLFEAGSFVCHKCKDEWKMLADQNEDDAWTVETIEEECAELKDKAAESKKKFFIKKRAAAKKFFLKKMKKKRAESKALVKKGDGKKGGDGEKGEGHGDGHHHKHEHKSPFSQEENEEFEAADHENKCKMAGEMTAKLAKEEKSGADMDK